MYREMIIDIFKLVSTSLTGVFLSLLNLDLSFLSKYIIEYSEPLRILIGLTLGLLTIIYTIYKIDEMRAKRNDRKKLKSKKND